MSLGWFDTNEPFRTTCNAMSGSMQPNLFEPRVMLSTRLVGEVHMSSGWFDTSKPFRTTCNAKNKAGG